LLLEIRPAAGVDVGGHREGGDAAAQTRMHGPPRRARPLRPLGADCIKKVSKGKEKGPGNREVPWPFWTGRVVCPTAGRSPHPRGKERTHPRARLGRGGAAARVC